MSGNTIAVLASGGGSNLQAIIDEVESGRILCKVAVVISDQVDAGALARAKEHKIPTEVITKADYPVREEYDREVIRVLKGYGVELVVLAGFMRILSPVIIEAFPLKIINIHPSLLPSFPGLDVQEAALKAGVRFSGCTVHFIDTGVDTGPIIIQAVVPVLNNDTVRELSIRILKEEHRIYPEAVRLIVEGRVTVKGQQVMINDSKVDAEVSLTNPPVKG
ncbi:MAG: phosphoribosylglycinamide formyltransferase [Deltaproteobacteria bacterium]|nr:phosphoribosylglycinamide formyltransferase [Deltaproteobacteria bacterium]